MPAERELRPGPRTEAELAAICLALGADNVPCHARDRTALPIDRSAAPRGLVEAALRGIELGEDPLGEWFCALRSAAVRRERGATYTPQPIVESMVAWAQTAVAPARILDPGAGSGRFLIEASRAFPDARLVAIEIDPLAALLTRANLAARELAARAEVHLGDYRSFQTEVPGGPTLFLGNPPYVRHHDIHSEWKSWLSEQASAAGLRASQLAGLHVHFFLATWLHARPGDVGAFITSSEWLDVNYGRLVRDLLSGPLGLERLAILDPTIAPFADAHTTAAIACFRVGSAASPVRVRSVRTLTGIRSLTGGRRVARRRLQAATRWSALTRRTPRRKDGLVELGELCRVHRGQVTGANAVWIARPETPELPRAVLRPAITRARELLDCDGVLGCAARLRSVIDLPVDLGELSEEHRELVDGFLAWARRAGGDASYVARHRSPWWAVKLRAPAPILATYMARRPPAFVRNVAGARHINIAHGLYPRAAMSDAALDRLARYLGQTACTSAGRTYAGGLTKFEPKEMERLRVPRPDALEHAGGCD